MYVFRATFFFFFFLEFRKGREGVLERVAGGVGVRLFRGARQIKKQGGQTHHHHQY